MTRTPPQSIGITDAILTQVQELTAGELPADIAEIALQCVLDWLGVATLLVPTTC